MSEVNIKKTKAMKQRSGWLTRFELDMLIVHILNKIYAHIKNILRYDFE